MTGVAAAFGELRQAPIERVKILYVSRGDTRARLGGKIADDGAVSASAGAVMTTRATSP